MSKRGRPGFDYIGLGVGAVIEDEQGRFLMMRRGPGCPSYVGTWEFPGGKLALQEFRACAVIREVQEELGIQVYPYEELVEAEHVTSRDGHWLIWTYRCRRISGEPRIMEPEKCTKIRWVTLEELKTLDLPLWAEKDREALLFAEEKKVISNNRSRPHA